MMTSRCSRIWRGLVWAAVLACLLSPAGWAATYYVAPDGIDDPFGGTKSAPWGSIRYGDLNSLLQPGDTVIVTAGTYTHNTAAIGTFNKCSGTAEAPITYVAQGKVVIDGTGNTGAAVLFGLGLDHIIFDGFEIFGSRRCLNVNGVYVVNGAQDLSEGVIIRNCILRDNAGSYTFQFQHTRGMQVYNNLIYAVDKGVNPGSTRAISGITSFGNKFWNNTIVIDGKAFNGVHDSVVNGGIVFGSIGNMANPAEMGTDDVRNNIIWMMHNTEGIVRLRAFYTYNSGTIIPYDERGWPGIPFAHSHNLQWPNELSSTWTYDDLFPDPWPHEFFYLSLIGIPNHYSEFYANPMFVDAANGDFSLAPGSPAIAAGVDVGLPYSGSAPNIGAVQNTFVTDKVGDALAKADGAVVKITGGVVTAASNVFKFHVIYIEDESRAAGIKVNSSPSLTAVAEGDRVDVTGRLVTIAGERAIQATSITATSGSPLKGLGMAAKSVAGVGLDNTGLLATVWGKVTYAEPYGSYFCIDDGSGKTDGAGNAGVPVVLTDLVTPISPLPAVNAYVAVTGIIGKDNLGGGTVPVIKPRASTDIN